MSDGAESVAELENERLVRAAARGGSSSFGPRVDDEAFRREVRQQLDRIEAFLPSVAGDLLRVEERLTALEATIGINTAKQNANLVALSLGVIELSSRIKSRRRGKSKGV